MRRCELNHLQLNTAKTKELVVDLRRTMTPVTPVSIVGHNMDIFDHYKYLGVFIDNKLDWTKNNEVLYKKGQSRLYFLRRLRSFNTCRTMLRMFYESVVASAILFAVVCWGSRLRVADANRLNKLIRKDVVRVELDTVDAVEGAGDTAVWLSPSLQCSGQTPSVRDSLLLNAPLSAAGSHSYLWPLNFTTPPSVDWTQMAIYKTL